MSFYGVICDRCQTIQQDPIPSNWVTFSSAGVTKHICPNCSKITSFDSFFNPPAPVITPVVADNSVP